MTPTCFRWARAYWGSQFGGKRNYGYGEVQLKDTQMVDLDELDYSRLEGAETYPDRVADAVRPGVRVSRGKRLHDSVVVGGAGMNSDSVRRKF